MGARVMLWALTIPTALQVAVENTKWAEEWAVRELVEDLERKNMV